MYSDLDLAIYATVHDARGPDGSRGPRALATRLGCRPGTLNNKADPACETHSLNISEAVAAMLATKDYRILQAICRLTGHVCIPVADLSKISDIEVLNAYAELHKEIGETAAAIQRALADGKISRKELDEIKREGHEDITAFFALFQRLEALCDE